MKQAATFYAFIKKREQIRLNREADLPWPWTLDPILQKYKFTNVRRAHDRTTQLLKAEFYDRHRKAPLEVQLLNCATFRYFGTIEFARAVGWQDDFYPEVLKDTAARRLHAGERVFTGAYVITNQGIKAPKQEVVVDIFLDGIWKRATRIVAAAQGFGKWRDMIGELQKVKGFGGTGFMAKEVVLDTMFTPIWGYPPVDLNDWCPAGPGARRGINRVWGLELKTPMTDRVALGRMLTLFAVRPTYWPADWFPLELHDIQFQLCEYDKYSRVLLGQGRPRSKYHRAK